MSEQLSDSLEQWLHERAAGDCQLCLKFLVQWWCDEVRRQRNYTYPYDTDVLLAGDWAEPTPKRRQLLKEGELCLIGRAMQWTAFEELMGTRAGCGAVASAKAECSQCGQFWEYFEDIYMGYPAFILALNEKT